MTNGIGEIARLVSLKTMFGRVSLLFVLIGALLLVGCGGGGGGTSVDEPRVYYFNASPDSNALQFKINNALQLGNKAYLTGSANFTEISLDDQPTDGYDISIHKNSDGTELVRRSRTFSADTDTLVFVHGLLNYGTEPLKRLRADFYSVNRKQLNGNRARMIIIHALEKEAGQFTPNIIFKNPGDNSLFATGSVAPGGSAVLEVDSGTMNWDVKRADAEEVFVSSSLTLDPGKVYLVVVSGVTNAGVTAQAPKITAISLQTIL